MALEQAVVKQYRINICKPGRARDCPVCGKQMTRHGFYHRTDVRLECGRALAPIPVQRWLCAEHGTISFLPEFLAKYLRYLPEVIGRVCDERLSSVGSLFRMTYQGRLPTQLAAGFVSSVQHLASSDGCFSATDHPVRWSRLTTCQPEWSNSLARSPRRCNSLRYSTPACSRLPDSLPKRTPTADSFIRV